MLLVGLFISHQNYWRDFSPNLNSNRIKYFSIKKKKKGRGLKNSTNGYITGYKMAVTGMFNSLSWTICNLESQVAECLLSVGIYTVNEQKIPVFTKQYSSKDKQAKTKVCKLIQSITSFCTWSSVEIQPCPFICVESVIATLL